MSDIVEMNRANGPSSLEWAKELLVDCACTILPKSYPLPRTSLIRFRSTSARALLLPNRMEHGTGIPLLQTQGPPVSRSPTTWSLCAGAFHGQTVLDFTSEKKSRGKMSPQSIASA